MKNIKVLIIDDDERDIKAMKVALQKEGYEEILSAGTSEKGVEIAKSIKPDVMLIDVVLNQVNGFDLCKQLKAIKDMGSKIIIVTGHLDAINADKARSSGADEIVEKTPRFENMLRAIKNLTEQQNPL
jgi:DNA-binding response OmpR family regulator